MSALLGVRDDTVRRWIGSGTLPAEKDDVGRLIVDGAIKGAIPAEFSRSHNATPAPDLSGVGSSQ